MIKKVPVSELTDNVAFITGYGKGISKNDLVDHIKEGWITYLVSLPLSDTKAEQIAITTSKHKELYNDDLTEAIEFFQEYKGEELSEDELAIINVGSLFVDEDHYI